MDTILTHDVREVVLNLLIPFFLLQFSGFRGDDMLLEGVGEDNAMAVEEASRRRADRKSKTAGPRSTSVGHGNGFTPLSGSPSQSTGLRFHSHYLLQGRVVTAHKPLK